MALDGTYTGLKASVADFLNRADLIGVVPDFITLAEAQMNRRLLKDGPVRPMLQRTDTTISSEFVPVPADFCGVSAFYVTEDNLQQLTFCKPEQIVQKNSNTSAGGLTGNPMFYSIIGGTFQFFPAPSAAMAAELTYWQRVPALSATNATNWLLLNHPDAYLYTSLMQAGPYLKDNQSLTTWSTFATTIMDDIVEANKVESDAPFITVPDVAAGTP